jgi:hypothetical protein
MALVRRKWIKKTEGTGQKVSRSRPTMSELYCKARLQNALASRNENDETEKLFNEHGCVFGRRFAVL